MNDRQLDAIRTRFQCGYEEEDDGQWVGEPQPQDVAITDVGELLDEVERLRAVILRLSVKQEPNA